ncbi:MAG: hypothetical protein J5I90_18210 [Caldilineales bacterium]|nr:hypothetical protein [Caldilineales bacterium]
MTTNDPAVAHDLETLRAILLAQDRAQLESLWRELEAVRAQAGDADYLINLIEPLLTGALAERVREQPDAFAEAIRPALVLGLQKQIAEERDSIIAVLTPIIGRTIQRAMAESFEAMARQVDARMHRVLDLRGRARLLLASARGVDESDLLMREALPWQVEHVFLIHNDSGLVLAQASARDEFQDSELVAALLTAIRSFARESLNSEPGDTLHNLQLGQNPVLLEEGAYAYLALVGRGVPAAQTPQQMREALATLHIENRELLKTYRGDSGAYSILRPYLEPLLTSVDITPARPPTAGLIVVIAAIIVLLLGCGWLTYRVSPRVLAHLAPTAALYIVVPPQTPTMTPTPTATSSITPSPTPTMTPTATPTASPSPTATPSPSPSPTASPTPSPPPAAAPELSRLSGSVYVRSAPDPAVPVTESAVTLGDVVRVLERADPWARIAFPAEGEPEILGWIPARWLGPPP